MFNNQCSSDWIETLEHFKLNIEHFFKFLTKKPLQIIGKAFQLIFTKITIFLLFVFLHLLN
jgi:hypothetical protein